MKILRDKQQSSSDETSEDLDIYELGLRNSARHVIECRFILETRVKHAFDDVASTTWIVLATS